jgi:hypothetical protein
LFAPASSKTLGLNRINTVRLTQRGQATVVEIAGERAPNFTTFKQMTPRRVIVDVAECDLNGVPKSIDGDGKIVEKITTAQYGRAPHVMSRVIIRLSQEAEYKVTIRGGTLFVHLAPGAGGLLVSAGVPVGPDRKLRKKTVAMKTTRDEALSEELSEPKPQVEDLGEPQEALHVDSVAVPEPAVDTDLESDEAEPDLVLAAARTPQATRSPLHKSPPEPVSVPSAPGPGPDSETESESIGDVASSPTPSPASVEVAMAQDEEADEVPVEVVEEVQEVNEEEMPPPAAPEEAEEPPPPPPPPPPEEYEEKEVPPPPEEYIAPAPAEERVEISSAIKNMTWVGFQQTRDASRVFIKTNEPVKFHVVEEGRNLIVLELENTRIPIRNNLRFLDTHFFDSAVTMIVPREIEGISRNVRVEIQLRNRVPYSSGQEGNLVYINFQRPQ